MRQTEQRREHQLQRGPHGGEEPDDLRGPGRVAVQEVHDAPGQPMVSRSLRGVGCSSDAAVLRAESSVLADATLHGELLVRLQLDRPARTGGGQGLPAGPYQVVVRGTGERGRVRLFFWRDGKAAGTADGAVLKQLPGGSICDRRDASDGLQKATVGSGDRGFDELGFATGNAFTVRGEGGSLRLVLTTSDGIFSIEATLASG